MTKAEQRQKSTGLSIDMPLENRHELEKENYRLFQDSVFIPIHLLLITNDLDCTSVRIISVLGTSYSYAVSNCNEYSCSEMK